ncbi:MAG TPA: hypothetical protein PKI05_17110, partial [Thermogutta sp.]|nr:hypothetical protein [Thermogutta sp.]
MRRYGRFLFVVCFALSVVMTNIRAAVAIEPPMAAKLFPAKTAVFFSIPDVPELKRAVLASSSGQMLQDPQLRPFLTDLWGGIVEAAAVVEKETGVSLEAILAIPKGELSVGLVSSEKQGWVVLIFMDAKENIETLKKLIDRGREAAVKAGAILKEEDVNGLPLTVLRPRERQGNEDNRRPQPLVAYAINGSTLIAGLAVLGEEDLDVIRDVVG